MMVVTPPAAAAWLADASVSRYSAPGSPTNARRSIRPGATTLSRQSTISVPSGTPAAPMPRLASRITPSAIKRSPAKSRSREGSTIRASVSRIGRRSESIGLRVPEVSRQRLERGHAHPDPHFDLLADQRLRAVGDARANFDAAVHGPRVHHQSIRLGIAELALIKPEVVEKFLRGRHERA